jgi:hypothetical protein
MKNHLHCWVLLPLTLLCLPSWSQDSPYPDSLRILFGSQAVTLPLPPTGNRTTLSFENEREKVEFIVYRQQKMGLSSSPSIMPSNERALEPTPAGDNPHKVIRWFPQLDIGYLYSLNSISPLVSSELTFLPAGTQFIEFLNTQPYSNFTQGQGASIALSIREAERPLKKTNRYFVNGLKFFSGSTWRAGDYTGRYILIDTTQQTNFENFTGSYSVQNRTIGLDMPFSYRMVFNTNRRVPLVLDLGVTVNIRALRTRVSYNTDNIAIWHSSSFPVFTMGTLPQVSLTRGAVGVYLGADMNLPGLSINRYYRNSNLYLGLLVRPFHKRKA